MNSCWVGKITTAVRAQNKRSLVGFTGLSGSYRIYSVYLFVSNRNIFAFFISLYLLQLCITRFGMNKPKKGPKDNSSARVHLGAYKNEFEVAESDSNQE